jgi:hypothetical protein
MRPYFSGLQDHSMKPFSFPLSFVFIFKYVDGELALAIVFPSGHLVQVSITDRTSDGDFEISAYAFEEHVIVAVPQLNKTVGPIKLHEYVLWTLGSIRIAELDAIKARITPRSELPPLR